MKTLSITKKQAEEGSKWLLVDATDVPVGRLATKVATLLRGKHKPNYTPHINCGDFVVVINADKVKFTGNKESQKKYFRYSGYIGGIKGIVAEDLKEKNPVQIIESAVKGMIRRGALGHQIWKRLKVYKGAEHPHVAQNPIKV